MSKSYTAPPPSYTPRDMKPGSTVFLAANEITQSTEKLTVKNAVREGRLKTSAFEAFMHMVKSSLGSGFLAMPWAFHNIGLVMGLIGTAFVTLLTAHCVHILVKCSQDLCFLQGKSSMTYTETVVAAFTVGGGGRFRRWIGFMRVISNVFMFITYYGVPIVYVILVSSSFKQVLENHLEFSMNIRWYALLLTLVLLPIGIIRHIKFLVPFSTIANFCLLVGCSLTMYYCFIDLPSITTRPLVVPITKWPLFFSTALFATEGIGIVMPVENAMRKPAQFLGCPSVLNVSMTVVALTYLTVGAVGYMKYGDDVEGNIALSLPQDWVAEMVKLLVALAILFTYPLQLTASMEVVWGGVSPMFSEKNQDLGYYLTRALLILGTVAIAIAVPNLSPVLSLVGAIGFSGLGLLVPTLTELVTYWDTLAKPCGPTIIKDVILIIIWGFATVSGSVASIHDIIVQYDIKQ